MRQQEACPPGRDFSASALSLLCLLSAWAITARMKDLLFRVPLAPFLPRPVRPTAKRALLVRDDVMGDLLVPTSAVLKWLQDNEYDVFMALRREMLPIGGLLLPEERLLPLDLREYRASPIYRYNFLKKLRCLGFSLAFGSTGHSSVNDDIVRNCGAPARYGYQRNNRLKEFLKLRGLRRVRSLPEFRAYAPNFLGGGRIYTSALEHERHFLSAIFSSPVHELSPHVVLQAQRFPGLPERYIHYVADAGNMRRAFPPERLLPELLKEAKEAGLSIALTALKPVEADASPALINLSGRLSLKELLQVTAKATVTLGNESGPVHLASILGIPTGMFYGGGHYGKFLPDKALLISKVMPCFGCGWKCVHPGYTFACVNVSDVELRAALRRLIYSRPLAGVEGAY